MRDLSFVDVLQVWAVGFAIMAVLVLITIACK